MPYRLSLIEGQWIYKIIVTGPSRIPFFSEGMTIGNKLWRNRAERKDWSRYRQLCEVEGWRDSLGEA